MGEKFSVSQGLITDLPSGGEGIVYFALSNEVSDRKGEYQVIFNDSKGIRRLLTSERTNKFGIYTGESLQQVLEQLQNNLDNTIVPELNTKFDSDNLKYTNNDKNYGIKQDGNHNLYVNIPWENTDTLVKQNALANSGTWKYPLLLSTSTSSGNKEANFYATATLERDGNGKFILTVDELKGNAATATSLGGIYQASDISNLIGRIAAEESETLGGAPVTVTHSGGTLTYGGSFTVTDITTNAHGRVTSAGKKTYTLPSVDTTLSTTSNNAIANKTVKAAVDEVNTSINTLQGLVDTKASVSYSRSLTAGTKIGTITVNGTSIDIYAPTDTNTTYTLSAPINKTNGNVTLNLDASSGTDSSVKIVGSGATTVASNSSGTITVSTVDTNSVTGITAGAPGTITNSATSDPYIKVKDDNTLRAQIQLKGEGATSVSSDANGVITITSTDNNTHYASSNVVSSSATATSNGAVSSGSVYLNSVENGAVTSAHKITGNGRTQVTSDNSGNITISTPEYSIATSTAAGLVKSGTDITVDSNGNVSVNDDSHNHVISNIDGLSGQLGSALTLQINGSTKATYTPASGNKTFNVTLENLGITGAFHFVGKYNDLTALKTANSNPTVGAVGLVGIKEYVYVGPTDDTTAPTADGWVELGDEGSFATTGRVNQLENDINAALDERPLYSHNHIVSYTPAGTVYSTFSNGSGIASASSSTIEVASSTHKHQYTPSGTINTPVFTGSKVTTDAPSGTVEVNSVKEVGEAASLIGSYANKCLTLTFNANTLPTVQIITVASNEHKHDVTAAGTIGDLTFTGTETEINSIEGVTTVNSKEHIHSVIDVSGTVTSTFTGTPATLTTSEAED